MLAADGLLDRNARLTLAPVPLRVGLITSHGSAAYHDFVQELETSGYAWQVGVVDVRVQGAAASRRIVWALHELARLQVDVVVLVRGGGSRADLCPFDTEQVAREIAAMSVPVLTGVGHEVDRSVADEVAHTACKTPTACAQILVDQVRLFVRNLDHAAQRVGSRARACRVAARELDDAARCLQRARPWHSFANGCWSITGTDGYRSWVVVAPATPRSRSKRVSVGGHRGNASPAPRHHAARRHGDHAPRPRPASCARARRQHHTGRNGQTVRRAADAAVGGQLVTELATGRIVSRVETVEEGTL